VSPSLLSSEPHTFIHLPTPKLPSPGFLSRRLSTPNTLEEPIALCQSVQGIIALGSRPHEPAQRVDLVLAGVTAVLVDLADAELDTGVVFGFDDAVGRAAFAGDVASKDNMSDYHPLKIFWWFRRQDQCLNRCEKGGSYRSTISPFSFSMVASWEV
jgi:hypothetical protein